MAARWDGPLTVLRPITAADLPTLAAWDRDPEIVALMGRKFQDDSAQDWYRRIQAGRTCRALAVEDKGGRLIGELEVDRIDWRLGTAEVRICIGEKEYWGRGYGTDALRTLLRVAFLTWGLRALYLRVYRSNQRAVRCYLRLGFTVRGVLSPSRRRDDPDAVLLMVLTRERYLRLLAGGAGGAALP